MTISKWNLDPAHSAINFTVRHMMFAKVRGRFTSWSASLQIDETDVARSSVEVAIDAASIDTGVADRDNHLRSPDFLEAEKFPKLRFKSESVEKVDAESYVVNGDLSIRDVTRPVALDVRYAGRGKDPFGNQRIAFTATASIERGDFGLKWNQVLEAGGVLVGEKVEVEVELQAIAAS